MHRIVFSLSVSEAGLRHVLDVVAIPYKMAVRDFECTIEIGGGVKDQIKRGLPVVLMCIILLGNPAAHHAVRLLTIQA